MTTTTNGQFKGQLRDDYLALIQSFPLKSIHSKSDLNAALKQMDRIFAKGSLSDGESMYLDALSDLIGAYEDDHFPIDPPTDEAMLRHLMEAHGITQVELHNKTGIAKSTISETLAGKKKFSRQMIRSLSEFFKVDPGLLAKNF